MLSARQINRLGLESPVSLERGLVTQIRTPYLYPDGDVIDLFYREQGEQGILTDLGETTRWLQMQTTRAQPSQKQTALLADICQTHGVEQFRSVLMLRTQPNQLADAVTRLGETAIRVSDLWFLNRTRAYETILDEVSELLDDRQIPFERNPKRTGRSGQVRRIDFHTYTSNRSAFIYILSTGNRASTRSIVDRVCASWYDLHHYQAQANPIRFISLFDDSIDLWDNTSIRLLENLSEVSYWSRPDELLDLIHS